MPAKVFPVIHHVNDATTYENARLAERLGCEGVFLIQMQGCDDLLDSPAAHIRSAWPHLKVGVNRLRMMPNWALSRNIDLGLDMTWSDRALVTSTLVDPTAAGVDKILKRRSMHLFFGAAAFKGQGFEKDPALAARRVAERGWVVTTSGPCTGEPPEIEKIVAMKEAIGDKPLAVASGMTPENVAPFARHLAYILVSTGISREKERFDESKLASFMQAVNG